MVSSTFPAEEHHVSFHKRELINRLIFRRALLYHNTRQAGLRSYVYRFYLPKVKAHALKKYK